MPSAFGFVFSSLDPFPPDDDFVVAAVVGLLVGSSCFEVAGPDVVVDTPADAPDAPALRGGGMLDSSSSAAPANATNMIITTSASTAESMCGIVSEKLAVVAMEMHANACM